MVQWHRNGFTLIELLVVIAIIGILASVIFSALSDARVQGVAAKVKSEMDSIAKRASVNYSHTFTYDTVCGSNGAATSSEIMGLITSINSMASSSLVCNSDASAFAISIPIESTEHWCVDSTGKKKRIPAALTVSPPQLTCP